MNPVLVTLAIAFGVVAIPAFVALCWFFYEAGKPYRRFP